MSNGEKKIRVTWQERVSVGALVAGGVCVRVFVGHGEIGGKIHVIASTKRKKENWERQRERERERERELF